MPSYVRGRTRGRLLSDAEIVDAYASGETSDSLAQRAACTGVTILQIVRRAGVEVRRPGAPPTHKPRQIGDNEIIRRYRAGETGPRLADAAGCTAGTIYRVLRQYDVEVRPPVRPGRRKRQTHG